MLVLGAIAYLVLCKKVPDSLGMNKFLPSTPELIKQIVITVAAVFVSQIVLQKLNLNGEKK